MSVQVRETGSYELIETITGTTLLGLDGEEWFAWVEGDEGEILVLTDDDHKRRRMVSQGAYKVVDFEEEPEHRDMPHLFLGHPQKFEEYVLPNGLPDEREPRKKIIVTDLSVGREELERSLEASETGKTDEEGGGEPDLPVKNYDSLTVDEIAERLVEMSPADVETLRRYEETHKNRKSLLEMFRRHQEGAR